MRDRLGPVEISIRRWLPRGIAYNTIYYGGPPACRNLNRAAWTPPIAGAMTDALPLRFPRIFIKKISVLRSRDRLLTFGASRPFFIGKRNRRCSLIGRHVRFPSESFEFTFVFFFFFLEYSIQRSVIPLPLYLSVFFFYSSSNGSARAVLIEQNLERRDTASTARADRKRLFHFTILNSREERDAFGK